MTPLLTYIILMSFVIIALCVITAMVYTITGKRNHKAVQAWACTTLAAAAAGLGGLIKVMFTT